MEKSPHHYPQAPPEMNAPDAGRSFTTAPPSYDQATTAGYPPQQGHMPMPMPMPHAQGPPQSQPAQVYVGSGAPYVGVTVGGPNASGGVPIIQRHYPTQQQGMPHQMGQQPVVIIQQQAMLPLGPDPSLVLCPACHVQSTTRVEHEPNSKTHLMAALLCILGFWCCVCLPYCMDTCMNANHYCGNCNKFLGTYSNSL